MTYNNTPDNAHRIDLADDADQLLMASLSEVDGQPVLHAVFSLKTLRQYDPDIHGILLNGLPPRFMVPLHPYDEDTGKRQAVQVGGVIENPVFAIVGESEPATVVTLDVASVVPTTPPAEEVPETEQPKEADKG